MVLGEDPAGVPEAMQRAAVRLHDAGLLVRGIGSRETGSVRVLRTSATT